MSNVLHLECLLSGTEEQLQDVLRRCFSTSLWLEGFMESDHHGFEHGNKVREAAFKLLEELNNFENKDLVKEGVQIDPRCPKEGAKRALAIAALFHDCGRINAEGRFVKEEQGNHHLVGAERAVEFCSRLGLQREIPFVRDAVESHDFQSRAITPTMTPPKTIIGKIVQATDQMGWFHPGSLKRTLSYNADLPFFDQEISLEERRNWKPNGITRDVMCVLMAQLFGPRGEERFGVQAAREKVALYVEKLEREILKAAEERNVREPVETLIRSWRLP